MKFADLELKFQSNFDRLNGTIDSINKKLDQAEKQVGDSGKAAERSANRVSAALGTIAKAAAAATVAVTGVFVGFNTIKATITGLDAAAEKIDNLGKVSKQLEIPIEQLSVLRFAAGESGLEFDTLAKMSAKAAKNLAEMVSEGKTILPIGRLKVQLTDTAGNMRSITDLLPDIAKGIEQLGNAGSRIDIASKIFGKEGGAEFVKFLADGGNYLQNMADQTDRARRLGVIFTDDQVKRLTAYRDAVGRVEEAFLGLKVSLMTEVAPVLTEVMNRFALQVGGMPGQIKAFGTAFKIANSGIPVVSDIAQDELDALEERLSDTFTITMSEGARVFGTVVLETITTGMTLLGPPLEDLMRDHVGPILNELPGVNIAKSLSGQRSDAIDEYTFAATRREDLLARRERLAALIEESDFLTGTELGLRMVNIDRELAKHEGTAEEHLQRIADLNTKVVAEAAARNELLVNVFNGSLDATKEVLDRAKMRIGDAWDALEEQQDRMVGAYGLQQVPSVASKPIGSFPIMEVMGSVADGWDALTARLESVEPKLGKVTDKLLARIAEIQDFRTGLSRRTAMVNAGMSGQDVDRLRLQNTFEDQVDALIKKLGRDSQLISELRGVQELELQAFDAEKIAKVNKETEQWVKSLRRTVDPASDTREQIELIVSSYASGTIDFELYSKAMDVYVGKLNQVASVGEKFGDTMSDAIKGFSDDATRAFADFALDGKGSFEEVARAFERMLFETATKALIWQPLFNALGGWFGGMFGSHTSGQSAGWQGPLQAGSAHGNVFDKGAPVAFANGGVVLSPVNFPMSGNRTGVMGEKGPEAIVPLTRIGKDLGIRATGGGVTVNIIDQRGSGERPQVTESTGPDGRRMIQILIRDSVKTAFSEGSMDTLMGRMYGLRRAGT